MKEAANGQLLTLAFWNMVERTKIASMVLRFFLKPNCSGPSICCSSAMEDMATHILTVISRNMFEGMVIGRYWTGCMESPP